MGAKHTIKLATQSSPPRAPLWMGTHGKLIPGSPNQAFKAKGPTESAAHRSARSCSQTLSLHSTLSGLRPGGTRTRGGVVGAGGGIRAPKGSGMRSCPNQSCPALPQLALRRNRATQRLAEARVRPRGVQAALRAPLASSGEPSKQHAHIGPIHNAMRKPGLLGRRAGRLCLAGGAAAHPQGRRCSCGSG